MALARGEWPSFLFPPPQVCISKNFPLIPAHCQLDWTLAVGHRKRLTCRSCVRTPNKEAASVACTGKCKVVPVHAVKAYRDSRGKAPLILNFGTRWRWVANFMPWGKNPETGCRMVSWMSWTSVSTHPRHQPAATWLNTTRYCKYSLLLLMMDENIARNM